MTKPLVPAILLALASSTLAQTFQNPPVAVDLDPDPNVVEVDLVAAETQWEFTPGVQTTVWAYNGSIPGPTIDVAVGQTVRVNLINNLTEPTTIHWHGVDLPATVDGSHIAQAAVLPGETFTYEWTALNHGTHWYHPHVRTNEQVEKGLYGVILIRDLAKELSYGFDDLEESVVVFDDVLLNANSQLVPAFSFTDPIQNALYHLNGREGNVLLVNGRAVGNITMQASNGVGQRWRVVNAANTTFCRLDLRDAEQGIDQALWEIGADGGFGEMPYPLYDVQSTAPPPPPDGLDGPDHPYQILVNQMGQGIFLMPGERMDVVFTPIGDAGTRFTVFHHDWFRGRHVASYNTAGQIVLADDPMDGSYPKQEYLQILLQGAYGGGGEFQLPALFETFPAWTEPPKGLLPITLGHGNPDPVTGDVTLFAFAKMVGGMMTPIPMPKLTSFDAHDVEAGDVWQWEITNLTHGEHPFHTHGFPFELIEYEFQDDVTPENNILYQPQLKRRFKDTIRCPPRLGEKGSSRTITRLRVTFDDTGREGQTVAQGEQATFDPSGNWTSGGWLAHCHILEHSAKGMMIFYELHDPADPFELLGRFHPGTFGNASLTAVGDVAGGGPLTLRLVNARPNTTAFLVAGNIAANRSFFGGTVVPGVTADGVTVLPKPLFAKSWILSTDAQGELSFTTPDWTLAPAGTQMYWQILFRDAGASNGWAYSNAFRFQRP